MAFAKATAAVEHMLTGKDDASTQQFVSDTKQNPDPSGERMQALAWVGKNQVELVNIPKPAIIEPRDVILKVTGSTVCGSDLHLYHGAIMTLQKGDILGHEFCGIVDSVGSQVTNLQPGQRVVASFQIACGDCHYCKQKLSSMCEKSNASSIMNTMYGARTAGIFGYSHLTGGFAGGQAEYVRVPFGDVNLLKLPNDIPDDKGLYLSDVICTSWNAVVDTSVKKDDIVAVWGAGPIGQMVVDFAFMNGASRVILIDNNWRLNFVKEKIPKVELVNFADLKRGGVPAKLKELTNQRGVDVAIDCVAGEYAKGWAHYFEILVGAETDTSEIVNEMIESCRNYGRCGLTGVYTGFTNHFNIGSLMQRGIRLIGNGQAPVHKYWEELLQKIQSGEIDPLKMVTHYVEMDDLVKVYEQFDKKEDGMQKVFVKTKFSVLSKTTSGS